MGRDKTSSPIPASFVLLALLIGVPLLYVAAYVSLHQTEPSHVLRLQFEGRPLVIRNGANHRYRIGNGYINMLFWPAKQVHERFNPDEWQSYRLEL